MKWAVLLKLVLVSALLTVSGQVTFAAIPPAENGVLGVQAGGTYYVANAPLGNDANSGTASAPWEHCPGMPGWTGSATLEPGDTVYFDSGGTWETSSGSALLQVGGGVTYDGSMWGAGTRATLRATGYLHRSVVNLMEDDPSEATVIRGFEVDANGQETSGIAINWPQSAGSMTGAMKRIEDCVVHDVFSASAAGSYEYGIVVSSGWGGNRHVSNVEILDCEAYNISRGGVNIYAANDDPQSGISDVLVRGCDIYATGLDPNYAGSALVAKNHTTNVVFEYNAVHDPVRGIGIGISTHDTGFHGPENLVIRHNIVANSAHAGMYIQAANLSVEIYGNLFVNNRYEGINFTSSLVGDLSARVYNNTFYHNYATSWGSDVRVYDNSADISVLEFTNNIIYTTDAVPNTRCLLDTAGKLTQHAYNIYYRPGGGTLVLAGGNSYNAGNLTSWEATALPLDPLFRNPSDLPSGFMGLFGVDRKPNTDGLQIAANSPARDSGVALSAVYSRSINSVTRPQGLGWDVGAYEFVPSLELYGTPGDGTIYLDWQVDVDLPPTSTWRIDYYTQTANVYTATDPLSATRSIVLTDHVQNYQWYTVTLNAMVDSTPILTDTVCVMPTNIFVHLPLVLSGEADSVEWRR